MAPVVKFAVFVVAALLVCGAVSGLDAPAAAAPAPAPLVARLHHLAYFSGDMVDVDGIDGGDVVAAADGEAGGWWLAECWGAVAELRSCTNEIVLFFLNGESYLGRDCCVAIRTVTRHCWPSMLASVGFTAEEADVLRGFCDAEVGPDRGTPPPPAPAPEPARAHVNTSATI